MAPHIHFKGCATPTDQPITQPAAQSTIFASRKKHRTHCRIGGVPDQPQQEHLTDSCLSGIVNKSWQIYKCSPLYNLNYDCLNIYSRHFTSFLQSHLNIRDVLGLESGTKFKTSFSLLPALKVAESDHCALSVLVLSVPKDRSSSSKEVFTAILSGVCLEKHPYSIHNSFVALPVILLRGKVAYSDLFILWLQYQFDCSVNRMTFSQLHLHWMVAIWAGKSSKSKRRNPIELSYSVPHVEGIDNICMEIDQDDGLWIWKTVHEASISKQGSEVFSETEVTTFINALQKHFFAHFKINLERLQLTHIGTPIVYVSSQGKIRLYSKNHVPTVLQLLCSFVVEDYPEFSL